MAITVQSQPEKYIPCYNNQWFVATSTQIAQPNFKYRVIMTDMITGFTITEDYLQRPSGELELDVCEFSKLNISNFFPSNLYGWQKCTNATRKIRVNIGEYYGTTPVYYAGSNVDFIVWNSAIDLFDFANYSVPKYIYNNTTPNYNYLSEINTKTFIDRSNYLYLNCTEGNTADFTALRIQCYDSSNALLGTYKIDRPSSATGIYTDQYQCIDVGYKGLLNIPSGQVTVLAGAYPIITSNVEYYYVMNYDTGTIIKTVKIDCSPYTVYTLHYLNSKGGYNTLHCELIADLTSTKTSTSFKKSPWSRVGYVKTLDPGGAIEKTLNVNVQDGVKVRSNFITQTEIDLHKDLFASPDVRLDLGSSVPNRSVKITNGNYLQSNFDLCRNLEFDLLFNHSNSRQKG